MSWTTVIRIQFPLSRDILLTRDLIVGITIPSSISEDEHIRCGSRSSSGSSRSVDVAHVDEKIGDVGEEVVVGEELEASSHASALPKNLIAPLPYRIGG